MPLCLGLSSGPCPAGRNDSSVRNGEGDLMLCPDCDREQHLEFLANRPAGAIPPVSAASSGSVGSTTSTVFTRSSAKQGTTRQTHSSKTVNKPEICKSVTVISAAKNDAIDRVDKFVCNEVLAYISCYRDRASSDALRRVVLNHFSAEDIGAAKKMLCYEFQGKLTGDKVSERRSSTSRAAHEAEIDDILVIFDMLDVHNTLEGYLFVGTNLSVLPKFGPEEMNIAAVTDRQVHMEEAVRELSSNISALKPDSAEIEQRLCVFEAAISSQLEKLTALADQLTATATLVKDFGSPIRHSYSHSNESTRDRSANVVVFGVNESSDMSVWRQSVVNAFRHVLGHDVSVDDMFRIGRFAAGKIRPIIVRLHSAWDRRLLLSGAFKLKSFDEKIFVVPDEPLQVRRKRQLQRLKVKAEREGKNVSVVNEVLSVDGVIVFTVKDGVIKHNG